MRARSGLVRGSNPVHRASGDLWPVTVAAIVVVAFVARAAAVLRGGGLMSDLGYDDGVYYGAAAAFVRGVMPYRDVIFVQPPGVILALTPFAWLGWLTSDATGFAAARLGFMAIGALNAGLVAVVAGSWRRSAGVAAGLIYAVWHVAAAFERTTILLAPENALVLGAFLVLARGANGAGRNEVRWRRAALAGALLGLATTVQLWNALLVLTAAAWLLIGAVDHARSSSDVEGAISRPRFRPQGLLALLALLAGATVAGAVVFLPFLVVSGFPMVRMLWLDQLGRPPLGVPLLVRLRDLEGGPGSLAARVLPGFVVAALATLFAGVTAALLRVASWTRLWAIALIVQVAFLLSGNVFFPHYSAWPAPAAALLAGTAAAIALERARQRPGLRSLAVVGLTIALVAVGAVDVRRSGVPLPVTALRAETTASRCVAADEPTLLIETGLLGRDVANRCLLVVDPTGVSYDVARGQLIAGPVGPSRRVAPGYQAAMLAYYGSEQASMFERSSSDGLSAATMSTLRCRLSVLVRLPPVTLMLAPAVEPRNCP